MRFTQRLRNLSLRYQVMLGISAAFLILFLATVYLALGVTRQSTAAISEARLRLATAAANSVDALVSRTARQMDEAVATEPSGESGPAPAWLQTLYVRHGLSDSFEWLARVRLGAVPSAQVVPAEANFEATLVNSDLVRQARQAGRSVMGEMSLPAWSEPRLVFAVPIPAAAPDSNEVLVGGVWPSRLTDLLPQARGLVARIVTSDGMVLADRLGGNAREGGGHLALLRPLIRAGEAGVVHHKEGGDYGHFVAYAPLRGISGGLLLEEPQDVALAVPNRLRTTMLWLGLVALAVLVVSAALHSQMVIRPVIGLAQATQNITRGILGEPIATKGLGEVEMLARNLEGMRLALKEAHEQRLGFERELEDRVRERTRQVEKLMSQIISTQEEERRRLARELHDETAQTLASVLLNLQAAQQVSDREKRQDLVARALAQQAQVLSDMRRIISALRPSALDDLGLVPALRAYTGERLTGNGVAVRLDVSGKERPLPSAVETAVFRILQEAVNNTAKHAAARSVLVRLDFGPDALAALVEDDGLGFDVNKALARDQVGLQGMRERAAIIGAHLALDSTPGKGTRLRLLVPVPPSEVAGG